jgi:hypothetical protein
MSQAAELITCQMPVKSGLPSAVRGMSVPRDEDGACAAARISASDTITAAIVVVEAVDATLIVFSFK